MNHLQNLSRPGDGGRAFGTNLGTNTNFGKNADASKSENPFALDKRQTRSMTKRNANRQPRPTDNGHNNVAGVALQSQLQQRPTAAAAAAASTNLFVAPTSRPTAFSSVSNLKSYQYSGKVDNIDERDKDDPLCATDYVQEMVSRQQH